jgi:5-methylcytosine-specific restriction protein A
MRYIDDPEIYKKYHCEKWRKVRKLKILQANGLCERCLKEHIYREGKIVHHKKEITKDNYFDDNVMYNLDNLEFLCDEHHKIVHGQNKKHIFDANGDLIGE